MNEGHLKSAAFEMSLECENLLDKVATIRWAWQRVDSDCAKLGEHENEIRTFADLMFGYLEYEAEHLTKVAFDLSGRPGDKEPT